MSSDGQLNKCHCLDGYVGVSCDECAVGYYGQPKVHASQCNQCQCSGNNDLTVRDNCDKVTGFNTARFKPVALIKDDRSLLQLHPTHGRRKL
jgi:hypothetical protein